MVAARALSPIRRCATSNRYLGRCDRTKRFARRGTLALRPWTWRRGCGPCGASARRASGCWSAEAAAGLAALQWPQCTLSTDVGGTRPSSMSRALATAGPCPKQAAHARRGRSRLPSNWASGTMRAYQVSSYRFVGRLNAPPDQATESGAS